MVFNDRLIDNIHSETDRFGRALSSAIQLQTYSFNIQIILLITINNIY